MMGTGFSYSCAGTFRRYDFTMGAIRFWSGLVSLGLACCGGSPFELAPEDSAALTAQCPTFGGNVVTADDGGVIGATALASTEHTSCLDAHCQQAATCYDRTDALPVCVSYANGGISLGLWVCPTACCY